MDLVELLEFDRREIVPLDRPSPNVIVADFKGQYQGASNWCWAAAAASVAEAYTPAVEVTQCSIVDRTRYGDETPTVCKTIPPSGACRLVRSQNGGGGDDVAACMLPEKNVQGFLKHALRGLGVLEKSIVLGARQRGLPLTVKHRDLPNGELEIANTLDLDEIRALIRIGRPICLRIVRRDFRHFIVIYGFEGFPDNDILYWDPAQGDVVIDFDSLVADVGPFTHKLITKPPGAPPAPSETPPQE